MSLPIRIFWLLVCLAYMAFGASVPLAWDLVPEAHSYRVWSGLKVLVTTPATSAIVNLPAGQSSELTVTAVNLAGESDHSRAVTIYVTPIPKVTVIFSENLIDWSENFTPATRYARAKIETP